MLESNLIYKHDESSVSPEVPYTYSPDESILVKYKGIPYVTTFETLYNICTEEEINEDGIFMKMPDNMYVADINGFTRVTHLTRKERHRDMVYVETECYNNLIVTDNHHLIIDDEGNTVDVINSNGYKQYSMNLDYFKYKDYPNSTLSINTKNFIPYEKYEEYEERYQYVDKNDNTVCIPKKIALTYDTGYFFGLIIGNNAKVYNDVVEFRFTNKYNINKIDTIAYRYFNIFGKIIHDFPDYDTPVSEFTCNLRYTIKSMYFVNMLKFYHIIDEDIIKGIPINILSTNEEFISGFICGLADSKNGSSHTDGNGTFQSFNRGIITQLVTLFSTINVPYKTINYYDEFEDIYYYSIMFDMSRFCMYRSNNVLAYNFRLKSSKNEWKKINIVKKLPLTNCNMEYIYGMTTESHTFVCNGLYSI